MRNPRILLTLLALSVAFASMPAFSAPGNGKGKGKSKAADKGKGKPDKGKGGSAGKGIPPGQAKKVSPGPGKNKDLAGSDWKHKARFHDHDRNVIETYFGQYKGHPHGLPPGLAKNLERGKPLPPGWEKKLNPGWVVDDPWWPHFQPVPRTYLPGSLVYPADTEVYLVGDRLVRVHRPTREVIDVIRIASILLR